MPSSIGDRFAHRPSGWDPHSRRFRLFRDRFLPVSPVDLLSSLFCSFHVRRVDPFDQWGSLAHGCPFCSDALFTEYVVVIMSAEEEGATASGLTPWNHKAPTDCGTWGEHVMPFGAFCSSGESCRPKCTIWHVDILGSTWGLHGSTDFGGLNCSISGA